MDFQDRDLHAFRDPAVAEDFAAPRPDIDVAEFHTYAGKNLQD
ncbi:hypothetical protein KZZ52_11615 [Dactylosporangium sp. AC04546]|nr:hypothetical protein [Dactylosporangium sp. AC04546]WVK85996.1 hypothetical protein KZZ52_11615 [Dactylosporangium sp. AC04546]